MRTLTKFAAVAATTLIALGAASSASASVKFDPATGTGFVGKGDVQTVLGGLNNNDIQNLPIAFTIHRLVVNALFI